ncbi:MAG: ribbon-helix-helix protein, CopG family [Clostridiales bacterium]|nr:ribbon-helix-helix protein, CopG family [Clostridiales bacterium]
MATTKKGRPTSSLKDYMLRVRLDKETVDKLDTICETKKVSRSEAVRNGIEEQYQKMKK